jgi:hypothetical protein
MFGPLLPAQPLAGSRPIALLGPAPLRSFAVRPLEILVRPTLDSVHLPLREHQMHMGLLAPVAAHDRGMDRPLVGMGVSDLLAHERPHQIRPILDR